MRQGLKGLKDSDCGFNEKKMDPKFLPKRQQKLTYSGSGHESGGLMNTFSPFFRKAIKMHSKKTCS